MLAAAARLREQLAVRPEDRGRDVSDGDQARRPSRRPTSLTVPGLVLTAPGDPMTLRSNAVELARVWDGAMLRVVSKAKPAGLIEGTSLGPGWSGCPAPTEDAEDAFGRC